MSIVIFIVNYCLADVHFVKSFEIGHYVYFFFRERTLECASCGKLEISRVARICKVQKNNTTNNLN